MVKAFLKAEIKGWKDNLADPALGATLAVNTYGKGLGLTIAEQTLESKSQNELHPHRRHHQERPVHGHRRADRGRTSRRWPSAGST